MKQVREWTKSKKGSQEQNMGGTPTFMKDNELHKEMDQEKSENQKKATLHNSRTSTKENRIREIQEDT